VDLLTVQTLTFKTLYGVLFIAHGHRELIHLGVTAHPTAAWVLRQLVEATAWGRRPRRRVRDRDAVYGGDFAARAKGLGIETILTPVRAPRANAIAERWVVTVRRECLDWLLPLGPRHLERVLREYVRHYNVARPHRALQLCPPLPRGQPVTAVGPVVRHDRLGGLLHEYSRCAA
jgi:transposase InsO family protein